MLILLFIFFLVLTVFVIGVGAEDLAFITGGALVICIIAAVISICSVVDGRYIDEKIEMYTAENEIIEEQINTTVEKYLKYESDTYESLKGDSGITLVSLYPELKGDELIKMQIETYTSNNAKIRGLKEKKINVNSAKWWLYFGG